MQLKIKIYESLCETSEFSINSIEAEYEDFGSKYDRYTENAEDYGCGDMRFIGKEATTDILKKYKITKDEYSKIVEELEEKLSFGSCGWCI